MGFENTGKVWTNDTFSKYLNTLEKPNWCKAITLHHTGAPSLADRPKGLLMQHIQNMKNFYKNEKGWSSGPHLFIDDDEIFGMSDLYRPGVHAVSFNHSSIGIEVLGNYDQEDPQSGRGMNCWTTAAATTKSLLNWLGLPATEKTVLFHRDDPTTKKKCPGSLVSKQWFIQLIENPPQAQATPNQPQKSDDLMGWNDWDYKGEKWCVPIYDFLIAKGVAPEQIKNNLKSVGGEFFYGSELLEGAYYDSKNQKTWAPVYEVTGLLA